MKRTDRLTNIIALLLFAAFLAYAGVYLARTLRGTTVTAQAVSTEIELGGVASGIVIRQETVLRSREPYLDITASEGQKLAAGSAIATAVRGQQGLERANRMHELEREIARVSAALHEMRSAEDVTSRETSLNNSSRALAAAAARHDAASLDSACLNLEALLLGARDDTVSQASLEALEQELFSLRYSSGMASQVLTAEVPGIFSSSVDGYEKYGPDILDSLTPSTLRSLIDEGADKPDDAYGKLVSDYRWYFAAVMSAVDAAALSPGRSTTLSFGRWYSSGVAAQVVSISPSEEGNVVVVFRCDTALAETVSMRQVTANVIFNAYSGIRIPAEAVRTDEASESTYVWTITAMQLERKEIEIIYAADDYVIVRRGAAPGALRDGNTVVVSGKDLYEGKLME